MIITISDSKLFVEINTKGAELWRVYDRQGFDYLWNGDNRYWGRRAPVLFPICGGMKNDSYTLNGKHFHMPKHGFCRDAEFSIKSVSNNEAVFYIESTAERYEMFPFIYRFYIRYIVDNGTLNVYYTVDNLGEDTMYFSVGSHEAYACPGGIEGYSIEFETEERLESLIIADNFIQPGTVLIGEKENMLPLKYDYFAVDALCFRNIKSKKIWLIGNDRKIEISFDGFEFLLFWTKQQAPFICIELNCGIDDFVDTNCCIETKQGIISLTAHKRFQRKHSMHFSRP